MPGENHLLHQSVSLGYMVLGGYKIFWVSASAGINWHNPCGIKGTISNYGCKGSASIVANLLRYYTAYTGTYRKCKTITPGLIKAALDA